ncbi:hypothetical protein ACJIZ3_025629 [Penstemon smallii]|uniref:Syntaxin 6/10/61 N-terminal domain-containing protein n=1 Tax=Penstemon smallii TaxID=265156 RepID=A0ABD3TYH1_9LAMI
MLVANSFDLWQKDTFFSAAEEVQQSADIMESAYRTWLRAKREGLIPHHLEELERELQMALGTAKWQLDEFERAVRMSYRNRGDDITITRHRQFVSAIEDQISCVETSLKESFNAEGKKPFRWVNLDEEECDDLALFLSGTPEASPMIQDDNNMKDKGSLGSENTPQTQISSHGKSVEEINENANCFVEIEERKLPEEVTDKIASNRRTWSTPDRSTLEIVIGSSDIQKNAIIEATPKEKGSKPFFWRSRFEDHPVARGGVLTHTKLKITSWLNQLSSYPSADVFFMGSLERKCKKSETTSATSVASSFRTFSTCFDANRLFSRALFALFSISNLNTVDDEQEKRWFGLCL